MTPAHPVGFRLTDTTAAHPVGFREKNPTQTLASFADRFPSIAPIADKIAALHSEWHTNAETADECRRLAKELQTASGEFLTLADEYERSVRCATGEEVEAALRPVLVGPSNSERAANLELARRAAGIRY